VKQCCILFEAVNLSGEFCFHFDYLIVLPRRNKVRISVAFLLILGISVAPGVAEAACSAAQSGSDRVAQRQLSALYAIKRNQGCDRDERGGLFSACRDVSLRIAEVQSQLASSTRAQPECAQRSRNRQAATVTRVTRPAAPSSTPRAAVRQASAQPVREWVEEAAPRKAAQKRNRGPANALTYCVRLSDGYLFPAPHSQYKGAADIRETMARCRFICEGADVDVYLLRDHSMETADMVSSSSGEPYEDLPTAYAYHGAETFKKCNWAGYVATVGALRSEKKAARGEIAQPAPVPEARPHLATVTGAERLKTVPVPASAVAEETVAPASAISQIRQIDTSRPAL